MVECEEARESAANYEREPESIKVVSTKMGTQENTESASILGRSSSRWKHLQFRKVGEERERWSAF